uniref:Variant surface glycoprotein 1071 n=1 Tax=Trypanosoma brucei TaxID=5691 RepID=M4SXJ5_9TRYP|nr:variant surface glycoprotein 1071 [Trypanosoma brucei]
MHQLKREAWLFLLVLAYIATPTEAAGKDENKNAADLAAVCDLINLASGDTAHLSDGEISTEDLDIIEALNMSLADPAWSGKFSDNDAKPTTEPAECKGQQAANEKSCQEHWKKWERAKAKAKQRTTDKKQVEITHTKLTQSTARAAAVQLAAIADHAKEVQRTWEANFKHDLTNVKNKVLKLLNNAAYGKDAESVPDNDRCDLPPTTNRKTTCELPSVGRGLCVMAVCLCVKGGGQNKDICGEVSTPTVGDWTQGTLKTPYAAYNTICKKGHKVKITETAITVALTQLRGKLKTTTAASNVGVLLGTPSSDGDCKGEDNKACADLTKATALTTTTVASIAWEISLLDAAETIRIAKRAEEQKSITETQIKALRRQAETIFKQVAFAPDILTKESTNTPEQTKNKQATEEAAKCEKFDNNATICANNDCNYDKAKNKCKPKPGTETAAAATGDGAAGAGPNCASHNDRTNCEKQNVGKDKTCLWLEKG